MKFKALIMYSSLSLAIFLCLFLQGCQNEHDHSKTHNSSANSAKDEPIQVLDLPEKDGMRLLPGGEFLMGSENEMPNEAPVHKVNLKPFWIDKTEVTVADFEKFVAATNYKTEAEKIGWSGVFKIEEGGWTKVDGANWRNPFGDKSKPLPNEPATQISFADANAYAKWAGKRLPTEAEWEYAARGGLVQKRYVWGDELRPGGKPVANWWQGDFPEKNTVEDGFLKLAPVGSFAPNGYGLSDMTGNIWEWTADWYDENYYQTSPTDNPIGPKTGKEKVIRGGSWLCSEVYCSNYRTSARSFTPPDSGLNNLGFRCVRD